MPELLDQAEIDLRLAELDGAWHGSTASLRRTIEFADFPTAVRFIDLIAPRCEEIDHHPDLALSWRRVEVTLSTHSEGGVTGLDFRLAAIIDDVTSTLPLAT